MYILNPVRTFLILITLSALASCKTGKPFTTFKSSLFKAYDHTAENIFTGNIEGPAVDYRGRLFVVNYRKDGTVALVKNDGSCEVYVTLPEKSTGNSIQFNRKGDMLVADFTGHNILIVDANTKRISTYCHNDAFNQPNDMCINKKGQLFVSDPDWKNQTGKLWRIEEDGSAVLLKENMGTTNGICLSPDGLILYVNESVQRKIWAFDVDEKGAISGQRLFASFKDFGLDGMKCDYKGNLYISRYGKGAVAIYNPKGTQIQEVMLKGKNVSNLVFGNIDYKTCFVTLQDRKAIEKFRTDTPGR